MPSEKKHHHHHLLASLRNLRLMLKRENDVNLMIARPTIAEFKSQVLPLHLRVDDKPRQGPRITVRKSRSARIPPTVQARWPHDHMIENRLPSMACVIDGTADLHIADYLVSCPVGDFMFYPGGIASADGKMPHLEGDVAGRQCSLLWIYPARFGGEGLECYICRSVEELHFSSDHSWCRNLLLGRLFEGICEEGQKKGHHESIFHLMSAMFFLMQSEVETGESILSPLMGMQENVREMGDSPIQRACAFIKANLRSNLTIESVARQVFLSSSVFTVRFKQQTGHTFNQYCTIARMELAAMLLRQTGMTVKEVSARVGLTDCQLRVLAHRYWGCPPREFRLQNIR